MESIDAVITHNVVAMRAAPDSKAELVSQAILSDSAQILQADGDYARIRTQDEYEGWALQKHLRPCEPKDFFSPAAKYALRSRMYQVTAAFADVWHGLGQAANRETKLVMGTTVLQAAKPRRSKHLAGMFLPVLLADHAYRFVALDALTPMEELPTFSGAEVCALGCRFIGTPYLWGGTTPFGFDCSGFVQRLYSLLGVQLPRDAYQQAASPLGAPVPEGEPLRAGDLVFFCGDSDPRGRGITHVGMALDAKRFLHASGQDGVAITPLSDPYYAGAYRSAWRYRLPNSG